MALASCLPSATGMGPHLGDQNTGITYADFLAALFPNVTPPPSASFTLSGLQATGAAQVPLPGLVIQNFTGGSFSLYAPNNTLLLQGPIASAALSGVIGPPGTGGLFTTSLGSATAGSLKDYFQAGTLSVSMNLTTVNGGGGFVVTPPATGGVLSAFTANAVAGIAGSAGPAVPEPTSVALILCRPRWRELRSCPQPLLEPIKRVHPTGQLFAFSVGELACSR